MSSDFKDYMKSARDDFYPLIKYYFDHEASNGKNPIVDSLKPLVDMLIVTIALEKHCKITQPVHEHESHDHSFVQLDMNKSYSELASKIPLHELIMMGPRLNITGKCVEGVVDKLGYNDKSYYNRASTHGFNSKGQEVKSKQFGIDDGIKSMMGLQTKCKGANINLLRLDDASEALGHTLIHYDQEKEAVMFNLEYSAPSHHTHGIGGKTSVAFGDKYIDDLKTYNDFPPALKNIVRKDQSKAKGKQVPYYGLLNVKLDNELTEQEIENAKETLRQVAHGYRTLDAKQIETCLLKISKDPDKGTAKANVDLDAQQYKDFIAKDIVKLKQEKARLEKSSGLKSLFFNKKITKEKIQALDGAINCLKQDEQKTKHGDHVMHTVCNTDTQEKFEILNTALAKHRSLIWGFGTTRSMRSLSKIINQHSGNVKK